MAEASNFKFGTQLEFAKTHHKIAPIEKSNFCKILWFRFNIYTVAENRNFKCGTQLVFANAHHKITPRRKVKVVLG